MRTFNVCHPQAPASQACALARASLCSGSSLLCPAVLAGAAGSVAYAAGLLQASCMLPSGQPLASLLRAGGTNNITAQGAGPPLALPRARGRAGLLRAAFNRTAMGMAAALATQQREQQASEAGVPESGQALPSELSALGSGALLVRLVVAELGGLRAVG